MIAIVKVLENMALNISINEPDDTNGFFNESSTVCIGIEIYTVPLF